MAGFAPIETPNFAQAALGGYQAGRAMGMQRRRDEALTTYGKDPDAGLTALDTVDPQLAEQLRANRDKREERAALGAIYAPQTAGPQPQALGAPQPSPAAPMPPAGTSPMLSPEANAMIPGAAPAAAPPAAPMLPPAPPERGDGLQINQDALARLFAVNPQMALQVRQFSATARKEELAQIQAHAEIKGLGATYLKQFPAGPAREAAFAQMKPELEARGFSAADLAQARLDDASLDKDITFGMGLKDLLTRQRQQRIDAAAAAEKADDNARADRGLAVREGALGLARERATKAGSGGQAGNFGALDDAALLAIANGNE